MLLCCGALFGQTEDWASQRDGFVKSAEAAAEAERLDEASSWYEQALEAAKKAGDGPAELAGLHRRHAEMFERNGSYASAREQYAKALAIQSADPSLRVDGADTVISMAEIAYFEDDLDECGRLYGEAIAVYASEYGRSAPETVERRLWLAGDLADSGRRESCDEVVEAIERECREDFGESEELAACLDLIGDYADSWLETEELADYYRNALSVRVTVTPEDSPERVDALLKAADSLAYQGLDEEAVGIYRRALRALGRRPDAAREAQVRAGLGEALASLDNPVEAAGELDEAIALEEAGDADPETLIDLLHEAGDAFQNAEMHDEAIARYERAAALAREHPEIEWVSSDSLRFLAEAYLLAGRPYDSHMVQKERLGALEAAGNGYSLEAADVWQKIGEIASQTREHDVAVDAYERALAIREAQWGADSQNLILPLSQLAQAYQAAGRPRDAERTNTRIAGIGLLLMRDKIAERWAEFRPFGLPGWLVALVGFVGVGGAVAVGGIALSRRLAYVAPVEAPAVSVWVPTDPAVAVPAAAKVPVAPAAPVEGFQLLGVDRAPAQHGSFEGQGGELFGIWIVNTLLTIVTLGLYHFWGKVRMRRYIWAHAGLAEDRFAFHGTARELFLGWLKGAPLLLFVLYGPTIAQLAGAAEGAVQGIVLASFALALLLWPIAEVGAHRYRLTRTSWRGVRFSFHGSPWRYLGLYLLNWPLWLLTFGLWTPFFNSHKRRFLIGHMRFGDSPFACDAQGGDLFGRYFLNWLLFFPTLGMYSFWYRAYRERYYWSRTTFRGARFRSTITGSQLFEIDGVGTLLILLTLGLAWPWVQARRTKVWLESIEIDGDLDLEGVRQQTQQDAAVGEGFADFLGLDMGFFA